MNLQQSKGFNFNITVRRAEIERETSTFSEMDPYVKVKIGKTEQKTSVCKNGGKRPTWNECLMFKLTGTEHFIAIKLKDKNTFSGDNTIGMTEIPLRELKKGLRSWEEGFKLFYRTRYAGTITLIFEDLSVVNNPPNNFHIPYSNQTPNLGPWPQQPIPPPSPAAFNFPIPGQIFGQNPYTPDYPVRNTPPYQEPLKNNPMNNFERMATIGNTNQDINMNYPTPPPQQTDLSMKNQNAAQILKQHGLISPFLMKFMNGGMPRQQGEFPQSNGGGGNPPLPPGFC